jgi:type I restriction enzyme R subunit
MDFKKATELFNDPDFDGEPVVIYEPGPNDPPEPPDPPEEPGGDSPPNEPPEERKIYVSGVPARIVAERIEYFGPAGNLITESYKDFSRIKIKTEFKSLDDFLQNWNSATKKQKIIDELEEHGIVLENLAEIVGKDFSEFDLICHIAFDQPPLTRKERANNVKKRNYFTKYGDKARAVLEALLDKYADNGISTIENTRVLQLKPFSDIGTPIEIINNVFGGKEKYDVALQELEQQLFYRDKSA